MEPTWILSMKGTMICTLYQQPLVLQMLVKLAKGDEIKTEIEDETPLPIIDESVKEPTVEGDKNQNSSSASSENEDTQMTL